MQDYDEITALLREWGPYQKILFFVLSLTVFPNGFCGMSIVFVGDIPEHRCFVPENLNLSEAWRNRTIPLVLEGDKLQYSKCRRYRVDVIMNLSETFPDPDSFNMSDVEQEPCLDGWEYSKDQYISTIVSEWDLVCSNDWKGLFSMSVFFMGVLVGSFTSGQLSDRFIPESPRWLLLKGRVQEAEAIFRHIAKRNGVTPPEVLFNDLKLEDMKASSKQPYAFIHLVKTRNIRTIVIINLLVWMILAIGYFGLSLSTPNLHGDGYLNCFFSGAIEVPAHVAAWFFLQRFPRKISLSGTLLLGGIVLFFIQLIPSSLSALATVLVMIGKFGATSSFSIVYVYTAELFPTTVRNMGVGLSSMACRLGGIISPYIFYLGIHHEFLPFILIGGLTLLSTILILFLPETLNVPIPDTIDQMQKMKGFKCRSTDRYHSPVNRSEATGENYMMVSKKEEN
ncbi:organic cation/carnitine transporter 2-like isoform X3 [Heterodontus francisci]|uniref:organic cation/carnitine transporter 2-like isoform X3 n=1 Tax=Heterodontus francisci TaxID=7792 RepID=UPI00355BE19D